MPCSEHVVCSSIHGGYFVDLLLKPRINVGEVVYVVAGLRSDDCSPIGMYSFPPIPCIFIVIPTMCRYTTRVHPFFQYSTI